MNSMSSTSISTHWNDREVSERSGKALDPVAVS